MSTARNREAVLARAHDATGAGELDNPDARVVVDNPVCGDRVTLEIRCAGGRVTDVAHNVRGCVLSQASAAIIGSHAPGCSRAEIEAVCAAVAAMLAGSGEMPGDRWAELAMFAPVAAHRNRHHCVLLPFTALRRALDAACAGQ